LRQLLCFLRKDRSSESTSQERSRRGPNTVWVGREVARIRVVQSPLKPSNRLSHQISAALGSDQARPLLESKSPFPFGPASALHGICSSCSGFATPAEFAATGSPETNGKSMMVPTMPVLGLRPNRRLSCQVRDPDTQTRWRRLQTRLMIDSRRAAKETNQRKGSPYGSRSKPRFHDASAEARQSLREARPAARPPRARQANFVQHRVLA
jgi:hypothetical protein